MSTNTTTKRVVLAVGAALLIVAMFAAAAFAVDDTSALPKADLLIMQRQTCFTLPQGSW